MVQDDTPRVLSEYDSVRLKQQKLRTSERRNNLSISIMSLGRRIRIDLLTDRDTYEFGAWLVHLMISPPCKAG